MEIRQEDLLTMHQQIWNDMLGFDLAPSEAPAARSAAGYIAGCVQLVGAWEGAVQVDCSEGLARRVAMQFAGLTDATPGVEDVRDAVGELANMAAGSVKALLPRPTHISLPAVADGSDYDLTVRNGKLVLQCWFAWETERVRVSLLQREAERAKTARVQ